MDFRCPGWELSRLKESYLPTKTETGTISRAAPASGPGRETEPIRPQRSGILIQPGRSGLSKQSSSRKAERLASSSARASSIGNPIAGRAEKTLCPLCAPW